MSVKIELVEGAVGPSLVINGVRVAGLPPLACGFVAETWSVDEEVLTAAIKNGEKK